MVGLCQCIIGVILSDSHCIPPFSRPDRRTDALAGNLNSNCGIRFLVVTKTEERRNGSLHADQGISPATWIAWKNYVYKIKYQ